jgi:hypothetical protein
MVWLAGFLQGKKVRWIPKYGLLPEPVPDQAGSRQLLTTNAPGWGKQWMCVSSPRHCFPRPSELVIPSHSGNSDQDRDPNMCSGWAWTLGVQAHLLAPHCAPPALGLSPFSDWHLTNPMVFHSSLLGFKGSTRNFKPETASWASITRVDRLLLRSEMNDLSWLLSTLSAHDHGPGDDQRGQHMKGLLDLSVAPFWINWEGGCVSCPFWSLLPSYWLE